MRVTDPLATLLQVTGRWLVQRYPHLAVPYSVMTVGALPAHFPAAMRNRPNVAYLQHDGDANVTGYPYPWVIPYSVSQGPVAGEKVVVHDGPGGPYIAGKLSS